MKIWQLSTWLVFVHKLKILRKIMDGQNRIQFLIRVQTGTSLTWEITGQLLKQITNKFSV